MGISGREPSRQVTPLPYNPRNKGLNGHPMLQKVVQAHFAGQSSRQIATWIHPKVCHTTISRHITLYVAPVLQNAEALKALLGLNSDGSQNLPNSLQDVGSNMQINELARIAVTALPVLTQRDGRIKAQVDRHRRLNQVIEERSAAMSGCRGCGHSKAEHPYQGVRHDGSIVDCAEYHGIPGGATGLLAGKLKKEGIEYQIDGVLLSELREHEKHIAIEQGQWQENAGTSSVSVQIICPQAPDGALPRITFASDDEIDVGEEIGLLQRPV